MNLGELREWAGIATFERGERLAKYEQVYHCRHHNGRITAQVQGENLYDVSIIGEHIKCTCLAASYQPICKHAVATLLVYWGQYTAAQAPLVQNGLTLPDEREVHRWLASLEKEQLLKMFHAQLEDNSTLFEALQYRCYVETQNESLTARQVTDLIDDALPYDNAWDYDEAGAYFEALDDKYHALDQALAALSDDECYPVAWHGIKRLNTVCIDYVDSTSGDYTPTLALFLQHLLDSLMASSAALTDKLAFIIPIIEAPIDISDSFLKILDNNVPALGMALEQALHSDALFEALPSSTASEICRHYSHKAATQEQWQKAIEWQLKMELDWHDWLNLGKYHLRLEQYAQAQHCLTQAGEAVQNPEHTSLINFACQLATVQGQDKKAWQIRWQQFEKRPSAETLKPLQALMPTKGKLKEQQQSDVIELLLRRTNSRSHSHTDVPLLVETALNYQRIDILLMWARHQAVSAYLGVSVADSLPSKHYDVACTLYHTAITNKVEETNNSAYLEAVKMIARFKIMACVDKTQHELNWSRFVRQLKEHMKRKRNFIRYLEERFTFQ
ncbi:SWIM zinc finger family protein [Vibrio rarus]|uniref:SWIM zinc finger family protein n=1 Tax=Vibrio rarus TaxID=413403 RepID=UPI0021C2F30C|nr:SWIM zinc finger family protein [Vibrio rarus]